MRAQQRVILRLACAMACTLTISRVALADEAAKRAKHHDAEGAKYFTLGEFEKAAAHYKKAYEAKPIPAFLYNIAQCHQRRGSLKDLERAVFYLESYLYKAPDAPNRPDVESEIAELKKEIRKRKQQQEAAHRAPAPASTKPPRGLPPPSAPALSAPPAPNASAAPSSKPFYKKWWFWALVGTVAAGTAVSTALVLQPSSTMPDAGTIPPGRILVD